MPDGQVFLTTASDWAGKKIVATEVVTLPSGAVIELSKTKLSAFLMADLMPMALLSSVSEGSKDGNASETISPGESLAIAKGFKKISSLIQRAVIKPRIIFEGEPKDGEVLADDVPPEDIEFLMSYVLRTEEAKKLEPFREGGAGNNGGRPVQEVQSTTVNNFVGPR